MATWDLAVPGERDGHKGPEMSSLKEVLDRTGKSGQIVVRVGLGLIGPNPAGCFRGNRRNPGWISPVVGFRRLCRRKSCSAIKLGNPRNGQNMAILCPFLRPAEDGQNLAVSAGNPALSGRISESFGNPEKGGFLLRHTGVWRSRAD